MAEETVALYEHVSFFHSGLSFSLISPRLISIIHHRCFKMINPFYLFPVRRINVSCLILQHAQWKCRRWKKFALQVWMCDAGRSIFLARVGSGGALSPAHQFSPLRWHKDSEANFDTVAVASLRSCFACPLPRRLFLRDLSSQRPETTRRWDRKERCSSHAAQLIFSTWIDTFETDQFILVHARWRYILITSSLAL